MSWRLIPVSRRKQGSFRPLSRGLFFNLVNRDPYHDVKIRFRPLSRRLFFNVRWYVDGGIRLCDVFVPFLGDFFSIVIVGIDERFPTKAGFRPLPRGLFFNVSRFHRRGRCGGVFVPFLGDFFSIINGEMKEVVIMTVFVPFLGDFFSMGMKQQRLLLSHLSFRPLPRGLFFNHGGYGSTVGRCETSFRPLPRGLFFNRKKGKQNGNQQGKSFRPLPRGLFFNLVFFRGFNHCEIVFVPFLGDFFSIACLRSPSPSALASAFAAGMGGSLHQALSFGDTKPISPSQGGHRRGWE